MSVRLSAKSSSYTDEMAQDAIGTILLDSAQINFTYDDVTPNITATIIADSINDTHIDWGTGANQVSADDVPDGATNAIITLTQETNFETAYTHSQDNTQAHSDYLLNNADDIMTGILTCDGLKTGDNEKVQLGTGLDFDLYHDGTDCKVDINTGDLDWTHPAQVSWTLDTDVSSGDVYVWTGGAAGELTASSGVQSFFNIQVNVNQSGTAGYKAIGVNVTETATGSGSKRILDFSWGGTSKFIVSADATGGIAQCTGAASYMQANEIRAAGDVGGAAGTVSLTSTIANVSTGVGTVLMGGTTARNSVRWGKLYSATTALYFPLWNVIT